MITAIAAISIGLCMLGFGISLILAWKEIYILDKKLDFFIDMMRRR